MDTFTCEHKPGCCLNDLDCPDGRCWIEAQGKETGVCGPKCRNDYDCPADYLCKEGKCWTCPCEPDSVCGPDEYFDCHHCGCAKMECRLDSIYFDFDEYVIRSDAEQPLKKYAECIIRKGAHVQILGNTDERGSNEYNLVLGQRRADSAKNYLVKLGVSESQIDTISYGEERPVCEESTETCWQKNRRDDFIFK